ncbi:MAG: antibiotic biosynthesis monooxygenase [Pseudomonadota bacterium]
MTTPITVLVEFAIADGKADAFAEVCAKGRSIVQSKEPGTLSFRQYFNADRSVAVSLETYVDSDALIAHIDNAREDIGAITDIASLVRTEVYGNISAAARRTFEEFNGTVYQPFSEYWR